MQGNAAIEIGLREFTGRTSKAFVRALNRAINSARTAMVREIAKDTGLKSKDVRDALVMRETGGTHFEVSLSASKKRIPLFNFRAKGPVPSRGKGRGVTYKLPGGQGRLEHAFIATMRSGHTGVFARTPGKFMAGRGRRQAIHEKFGPSLGQVFSKFRSVGIARAMEVFEQNFDHEMDFANSGGSNAGTD